MALIFWDLLTIPLALANATEDTQNFLVMFSCWVAFAVLSDLQYVNLSDASRIAVAAVELEDEGMTSSPSNRRKSLNS